MSSRSTIAFPARKVCVTGGAGFIGSKLVSALLDVGADVVVIDDLSVGRSESLPRGVRLDQVDIRDTDRVTDLMLGCDLVYHLAARVAVRSSFEFVVSDTAVNVSGTASVLRAAQLAATVRKVVFTSSMAVYADSPLGSLVDEQWPTRPLSPYGISKLAAESLVHQFCAFADMNSVVLRLFNTYGVGQRLSPYVGAITIFCKKLSSRHAPQIFGDGEQSRDFVHVQDVVQALLLAGRVQSTGETVNVGTGVATTVNQVVAALQEALQVAIPAEHVRAVAGELRSAVANIEKARTLLGYSPQHEFATWVASVARDLAEANAAVSRAAQ